MSGVGTIVEVSSSIEINDPFVEAETPFLLALIQLEEDERLVIPTKLVGPSTPSDTPPGTAVVSSFERTSSDTAGELRLVFRPTSVW